MGVQSCARIINGKAYLESSAYHLNEKTGITNIKRFRKWQFEIMTTLMLTLISWNAVATDLAKGPLSLAGIG
jgi:hypothetical protein